MTETLWHGIEGIVLDAVGTLIYPAPSVAEVYRAAAERQGVALSTDELKALFRTTFAEEEARERLGSMVTDETLELQRWRSIVTRVLTGLPDPDRAFGELWDHFGRPEAWRCFPDVAPAVAVLQKSGIRMVIGSNFDSRLRVVAAGLPELSALRDALVISSEVGYRKPHEGFYRAACGRLGFPPGKVLCVGDDLENDVQGAARAGLHAVYLDRGGHGAAAPNVLSDLGELVAIFVARRTLGGAT